MNRRRSLYAKCDQCEWQAGSNSEIELNKKYVHQKKISGSKEANADNNFKNDVKESHAQSIVVDGNVNNTGKDYKTRKKLIEIPSAQKKSRGPQIY
jgi:hypothetical protein